MKLGNPDSRTLTCTDLLLEAEVFISILLDGRQTGSQGTPSAINTCFGWVLFGKIKSNDVVDVANLTLERSILKDIAGLTYYYVAVLSAD